MANLELATLNEELKKAPHAVIAEAEAAYSKKMDDLVAWVTARPTLRILLLAGPSSSGKTTSANILKDRLHACGHPSAVVSLDDFYRSSDDPAYPLQANGEHDYESIEALELSLIHECLAHILRGDPCMLPRYHFSSCRRTDNATQLDVPPNGYVIVEGLHALNPRLTDGLPPQGIGKLFVSVSTNITENGKRILSGRKIRFLRRLTRDAIYRGTAAAQTLMLWQNVLAGEDRNLYPYKECADVKLDTFHRFELGVLRPLVTKRFEEDPSVLTNPYAACIAEALYRCESIPESYVPQTSLIREFIPGGIYENLY